MKPAAVLFAALLAAAGAAAADAPLESLSRWLPEGSTLAGPLAERPARRLASEAAGGTPSQAARLGELAFRSPVVFGGEAARTGLSCETCHPAGHLNRHFFVPGLSDRPGNVDVSGPLFQPAHDDGIANPVNIPSLRGVAGGAPFGRDGRHASLRAFVRDVVVVEFAGAEPEPWLLDALLAYLRELEHLPGGGTDGQGRLLADAGAAARRGEALFHRPFPGPGNLSCATCHPPHAGFADGRSHDVGTGAAFDTPGLRGLADSAPYFHDGRAERLADAVAHFDRVYALRLDEAERADLVAYLEAVGRVGGARVPVDLAADLAAFDDLQGVLDLPLRIENRAMGVFAVASLRRELGRIHERFTGDGLAAEREALVDASRRLAAAREPMADGRFADARAAVAAFRAAWPAVAGRLRAAEARSLYDPARLREALAAAAD